MKTASRLLALSVLATGAVFTTSTFACSTAAWSSVDAAATAGDPLDGIARVAGKCGLEVTASGTVLDDTPDGETTFIARFYFFGADLGAGTHEIFSATSADAGGGTEQFVVTYDGTDIAVDASGGGGGSVASAAEANKWNLVEVMWTSGGNGSLWVNADATVDAASGNFASGSGSIGSAQLGAVGGVGADTAFFDDYVSHRSLPVGPVLLGDTNNDGQVNVVDATAVLKEADIFSPQIQDGTPDCNLDGEVNIVDATGILKAGDIFSPVPCG